MDFSFTAEEESFRQEVRAFLDAELPQDILPAEAGLIVADAYGAEILRKPQPQKLAAARRKAVTLRFARAAALRLQAVFDPKIVG